MKIRIIDKLRNKLPEYITGQSTGMDLKINIGKDIILEPRKKALIKTWLYLESPVGYETQIKPHSELAINKGITVVNYAGTIWIPVDELFKTERRTEAFSHTGKH